MSVKSKMTAIADGARALSGGADTLTLEGIAAALGAEKAHVTAALAAIAEKGVQVPSGSTSGALAELIAGIETGNGAGTGIDLVNAHDVFTGTFTFAEDTICNTHRISVQLSDNVQSNKRGMYAFIYDTTMDANPTSSQNHSAFHSAKTNQFISAAGCAFTGNAMPVQEGGHFYKSGTSAMSTNSNFYVSTKTTEPSVYVGSSDSTRFYGAGRTYAYLFFTLEAENY